MALGKIGRRSTLKTAKFKATTDNNGDATILLTVPGIFPDESRYIIEGTAWFDNPHTDDYVEIYVKDTLNKLGYGEGARVNSFTDDDLPAANRGHYFPPGGVMSISAIADGEALVAELDIEIVVKKGNSTVDTIRGNIKWGTI